jgi:four helix bundle protein
MFIFMVRDSNSYQNLLVWQKSLDFTVSIYFHTKYFPLDERFGMTSQMRRAAVSISSNIAEGQARHTHRQFIQFLSIARGSLSELETQIIIASRLNYISNESEHDLLARSEEIGKMLVGLIKSIR